MMGFLLSHVWIKKGQEYKHDLINRVLSHYKYNYPDYPIIISGHGIRPPEEVMHKAEYVIWYDDIIESEVGRGHPKCVSEGLLLAKKLGWKSVFKNRSDMIIGCNDIFDRLKEHKCVAFYEREDIHDISIFANTDVFLDAWDQSKWDSNLNINGVINCNNSLRLHGHNVQDTFSLANNKWLPMVYIDPWWEEVFKNMSDETFFNNKFDTSKFTFFSGYSHRGQSI